MKRTLGCGLALLFSITLDFGQNTSNVSPVDSQRALVNQYCAGCHNDKLKSGGFSWTSIDLAHPEQNAEQVEKVVRKVRSGMMPPAGMKRPDIAAMKAFAEGLESKVHRAAAAKPFANAPALHRVNRAEYHNAVHHRLGIDADVS